MIDIAHTLQRQGPPTVRLAIPSGRVLPTVGFAAWPGALGLTALSSPARVGLRSGVGIPLADSLPVRLGLGHVVGYLLRDVRSQ